MLELDNTPLIFQQQWRMMHFAAVSGGVAAGGYGSGTRINDLGTSICKIDNWSTSACTDSAIVTLVLLGNSA